MPTIRGLFFLFFLNAFSVHVFAVSECPGLFAKQKLLDRYSLKAFNSDDVSDAIRMELDQKQVPYNQLMVDLTVFMVFGRSDNTNHWKEFYPTHFVFNSSEAMKLLLASQERYDLFNFPERFGDEPAYHGLSAFVDAWENTYVALGGKLHPRWRDKSGKSKFVKRLFLEIACDYQMAQGIRPNQQPVPFTRQQFRDMSLNPVLAEIMDAFNSPNAAAFVDEFARFWRSKNDLRRPITKKFSDEELLVDGIGFDFRPLRAAEIRHYRTVLRRFGNLKRFNELRFEKWLDILTTGQVPKAQNAVSEKFRDQRLKYLGELSEAIQTRGLAGNPFAAMNTETSSAKGTEIGFPDLDIVNDVFGGTGNFVYALSAKLRLLGLRDKPIEKGLGAYSWVQEILVQNALFHVWENLASNLEFGGFQTSGPSEPFFISTFILSRAAMTVEELNAAVKRRLLNTPRPT